MVEKGIFLPIGNDLLEATRAVASAHGMTVEAYIITLVIRDVERKECSVPLEERIAQKLVLYAKDKCFSLANHLFKQARKNS